MSVFIKHVCEVCGTEALDKEKKRCYRCEGRYDRNKVAYVLYCEFYRFVSTSKVDKGREMWLWVCDDKVQKAPRWMKNVEGMTLEELEACLNELHWELAEVMAAQVEDV